ncbi:MAG: hypothetical protein JSS66_04075 [Armatimonadetes bacterium]|nr:hypothetical protein [Armatimonadota bacterium]
MRPVQIDKIASVTLNCALRREVRVDDAYPCQEGDVIAVRVLTAKSTYNTLELTTGRMSALKPGDVILGALGHRNASQGYSGVVPSSLSTGASIQLLNLGGVLGECTSYTPAVGAPFDCEVLGQVLEFPVIGSRLGSPANIGSAVATLDDGLLAASPHVVAVAGTAMNSGKTEACNALIQQLVRSGRKVAAAKLTGVSLRRDVLAMEDAGAVETAIFTDLGIVTTQPWNAPGVARTLFNRLAAGQPDTIVFELGDGIMGRYGVDAILSDQALVGKFSALILAAGDPVGAWGASRLLNERYGLVPTVVTGPATDNLVGQSLIEEATGLKAVNARQAPAELAEVVLASLKEQSYAK